MAKHTKPLSTKQSLLKLQLAERTGELDALKERKSRECEYAAQLSAAEGSRDEALAALEAERAKVTTALNALQRLVGSVSFESSLLAQEALHAMGAEAVYPAPGGVTLADKLQADLQAVLDKAESESQRCARLIAMNEELRAKLATIKAPKEHQGMGE